MNVIVDTCVWSLALRRRAVAEESPIVHDLEQLVGEGGAVLIGPVRQELLSGIRSRAQFEILRERLRAFPDLRLETADFERAAEHFGTARSRALQGSNTDFLICAVAERRDLPVFTTDKDFDRLAEVLPIRLHRARAEMQVGRCSQGRRCLRLKTTANVDTRRW